MKAKNAKPGTRVQVKEFVLSGPTGAAGVVVVNNINGPHMDFPIEVALAPSLESFWYRPCELRLLKD